MTIIDSYNHLYNYDLLLFLWYAGCIFAAIGSIISFVMMLRDSYSIGEASIPMVIGIAICAIFFIISVPFTYTNKNTTCYKVVLEPSFTEDEFNAITTGFFIDSYKDGFWYLEELNPKNEVQRPNTEEERHIFYLIYSGDEGEVEKLTFVKQDPHNIPSDIKDPHNIPSDIKDPHNIPSDIKDPHNIPSDNLDSQRLSGVNVLDEILNKPSDTLDNQGESGVNVLDEILNNPSDIKDPHNIPSDTLDNQGESGVNVLDEILNKPFQKGFKK